MSDFSGTLNLINSSRKICILSHQKPDGDAIGSMLALTLALRKIGKVVEPKLVDDVPQVFRFLPGVELIGKTLPENVDLWVLVDAGCLARTGWSESIRDGQDFLIIDHHYSTTEICERGIVDATASSTGELVYVLLRELGVVIDKDIATCLLTCLLTDTGSFQFSNTSERVLKLAAELILAGGRLAKISENIYNRKTLTQLKLWGKVLAGLRRDPKLGINVAVVTMADLAECNATTEDLEGVVSLLNTVPDTRATFLFSEWGEEIKGSIRTESPDVNVAEMAKLWGGGGHMKAAGFNVSGHLRRVSGVSGARWELV